ncbi:hypothetical protein K432DRAFT_400282 [Lepidopterella palustris CBS 459.81]|uniref:Uncharacterized protein n=1 Tax=Lepidopterella palustris CBS 459.81 TaxID=1314670 RepID=A0A8E2JKK2_9PEZI|nr:hypothetical protein K432DRAFT_400282 [Lepidopterella palustris CBS 459.81]
MPNSSGTPIESRLPIHYTTASSSDVLNTELEAQSQELRSGPHIPLDLSAHQCLDRTLWTQWGFWRFGTSFSYSSSSDRSFQRLFPGPKLVLPIAKKRHAVLYKQAWTNQWLDNYSLEDPT